VNPPKAARTGWKSNIAIWSLACLGSVVLGIIIIAIGAHLRTGPYGENSNAGLIGLGVTMIVATVLFGIIAVFLMIVSESSQRHAAWLAQYTPEQQVQIRKAERAALWAGTAVAAVALHEHTRRTRQASAAAFQASHASYVAQQQHQELIDAIQGQQAPAVDEQTAATKRMLAQSAANRNNRGWS
jgi:Na+-transporting methylmalonyl-CoA/oxaloacetate decarboxylase gamma subunit